MEINTDAPAFQDRTSLGNALTDNFGKHVGIQTPQINIGQSLFTLGMVLLELPSNVVAKALGPNRWIPCIMVIWGVITLSQAFLKTKSGFYATRFLLAAGEVSVYRLEPKLTDSDALSYHGRQASSPECAGI